MTLFGFVVGSTLVNTLFLFDLYVTKFTQRSYWGSTMYVVLNNVADTGFRLCAFFLMIVQWFFGIMFGNDANILQLMFALFWWGWMFTLYAVSTIAYYNWEINKKEK